MSPATIQLLRVFHILTGAFWVGAVLFMVLILLPALRNVGPASGQVMEQLTAVRKLPIYMSVAPLITVLSGLGLYWNASNGFSGQWMHSGPGRTFGVGAALALIVMIMGMSINAPTGKRLGKLGGEIRAQGGPPNAAQQAELHKLHARMGMAMTAAAVLLVLALGAMSLARYMPA